MGPSMHLHPQERDRHLYVQVWVWVGKNFAQGWPVIITRLGYWVVFDSFRVALSRVIPGHSSNAGFKRERIRRPFGYNFLNLIFKMLIILTQEWVDWDSSDVCSSSVFHVFFGVCMSVRRPWNTFYLAWERVIIIITVMKLRGWGALKPLIDMVYLTGSIL